ncbi:unnamed protein product [Sphagnum balticum]
MVKCKQEVPEFLLKDSHYPSHRIKELQEIIRQQELPSDMPPPPPPPERVKEEEYTDGASMERSIDRKRDQGDPEDSIRQVLGERGRVTGSEQTEPRLLEHSGAGQCLRRTDHSQRNAESS